MRLARFLVGIAGLLLLAGCGTLPNDGPSAKVVEKRAEAAGRADYALVNLDYAAAQAVSDTPRPALIGLVQADSTAPTDMIREGDALSVTVFESGGAPLFGRGAGAAAAAGGLASVGGQSQDTIPRLVVDRNGAVTIPFAGSVRVGGLTTDGAANAIRAALRGKAVDPQVLVSVLSSAANTVSVLGEVRTPGRFPISANSDRLLDVIAAAGGPTKSQYDVKVMVVRGDRMVSAPLSLLMQDASQNIRLAPHDQVRLLAHERKFDTFGALGRVTETPMVDDRLTLAAALSRDGGLDTYSADNSAVFVFRFERPEVARALGVQQPATVKGVPIVYHLNMRDPNSYFVAGAFEIAPEDILYVPRASSIGVKKFLDLVSVVTNVTYTAAVTGANVP